MLALLAQLDSAPGDPDRNLDVLSAGLRAHPDADLAVFPEMFLCGYELALADELAEASDGESIERVRQAAREADTAVIVGFAERTDDGRVANAAACIDRDGALAGVYRKTHLFSEHERHAFAPGESLLLVSLANVQVGPMVCFDMEFPEPARALCGQGAELLVTIAANMEPYGPDHDLLARARALENRRAHLYVNRVGAGHGLQFVGGSRAIDSGGRVIANAGAGDLLFEVEVPLASAGDSDVEYLQHMPGELPVRAASLKTGERGRER